MFDYFTFSAYHIKLLHCFFLWETIKKQIFWLEILIPSKCCFSSPGQRGGGQCFNCFHSLLESRSSMFHKYHLCVPYIFGKLKKYERSDSTNGAKGLHVEYTEEGLHSGEMVQVVSTAKFRLYRPLLYIRSPWRATYPPMQKV